MSGQVINRREQHKQHTRAALEEAALLLFARQGYERTTVEEIAAHAGVSLRTFFRYFSSKQHVLFGDVAHGRIAALGRALAARPAEEDPLESVRNVLDQTDITDPAELAQIRARISLMTAQPGLVGTYLMINRELQLQVAAFVADRAGVSPNHHYPLTIAAAAAAAWDVALFAWAGGEAAEPTGVRRAAFAQLSAGITADTKT